jgi:hypothetical protein
MTPYRTSSGLQIGCRYQPPQFNNMTAEDELWQGVLLGKRRRPTGLIAAVIAIAAFAVSVYLTAK